jgi:hypothetical protein
MMATQGIRYPFRNFDKAAWGVENEPKSSFSW